MYYNKCPNCKFVAIESLGSMINEDGKVEWLGEGPKYRHGLDCPNCRTKAVTLATMNRIYGCPSLVKKCYEWESFIPANCPNCGILADLKLKYSVRTDFVEVI